MPLSTQWTVTPDWLTPSLPSIFGYHGLLEIQADRLVDIDNTALRQLTKGRSDNFHIACQADQFNLVLFQEPDDGFFVVGLVVKFL